MIFISFYFLSLFKFFGILVCFEGLDTMREGTSKGKAPLRNVNALDVIRSKKRRDDHAVDLAESAETSRGEAVPSVSEGVTPAAPHAPYVHHVEALGPQDTPRAGDVSVEDHDVDQNLNLVPNVLSEETSGGAGKATSFC
jgi:hypothetical protein